MVPVEKVELEMVCFCTQLFFTCIWEAKHTQSHNRKHNTMNNIKTLPLYEVEWSNQLISPLLTSPSVTKFTSSRTPTKNFGEIVFLSRNSTNWRYINIIWTLIWRTNIPTVRIVMDQTKCPLCIWFYPVQNNGTIHQPPTQLSIILSEMTWTNHQPCKRTSS